MRGTLESNWLCPVWRISIMLGGSISKLGVALSFLAITALEFRLIFGIRLAGGSLINLLPILLLTIASIYGIGLAFGCLVLRFKEANAMVFLVRGIFMIFCGITAPIAVLPSWMQEVAAWLPLTYTIRAIRAVALNGATLSQIGGELAMLALFAVVLPLGGFVAFRFTERRARRTGSLAQY
jgi:ABC-2 type transport system permease protein